MIAYPKWSGGATGLTSLVTGGLIVANQLYGSLVTNREDPAAVVNTPPVIVYSGLNILAFFLLVVSLIGLYLWQADRAGRFGMVAFLVALFGTLMVFGDAWFEAFVVPMVALQAPEVMQSSDPHPLFITGALTSFAFFSAGWILFGLAGLRARVFPRWPLILLIAGAVIGFLPLTTPRLVPLGLALAWLGGWLVWKDRGAPAVNAERVSTV